MNESHIMGLMASTMQFVVAAYALRLNRRFGISRVGWSLFGSFSLLALLQLVQAITEKATGDSSLLINAIYVLISFLLIMGMVHLESMLKDRLRLEQLERQMRNDLEEEVKLKTAYLTRAIEELMQQMEETKRMSAIIESAGVILPKTADGFGAALFDSESEPEKEGEMTLAGISAEWVAHF
jgi:hypothetical protein